MHKQNLFKNEKLLRIIAGISLVFIGTIYSNLIIALISIILLYTGLKNYCFVYDFLKINNKSAKDSFYLSLLPKHNPEPVMIFNTKGDVVFMNKSAQENLDEVTSLYDFQSTSEMDGIDQFNHNIFKIDYENKLYLMNTIVLSEEGYILAYCFDITETNKANQEIIETQKELIYTMGEIAEARSKETGNHVKRVALYSELLAKLYGLSEYESELIKHASPMHDIGKVAIPDEILKKPGKLTYDEFEIMKTHAEIGFNILSKSDKPILKASAIISKTHHEKWDGSGYPEGQSGEEISIYGRITAIADVFDALGSDRCYKKAWELDKILDLLKEQKGKHFDPKLIDLFLTNLDEFLKIRDKYK